MSLARFAGACYVLAIVTGTISLLASGAFRQTANMAAAASYVIVTVLFFFLFKPVDARVSLFAAIVSLAGCVLSALPALGLGRAPFNPLGLFGVYCLTIAWLLSRSTLPRFLAVVMAIGGVGWLTFLWPPLSRALLPYNFIPGIFGETVLTLWLLATGPTVRQRLHSGVRPHSGWSQTSRGA